MMVSDEEIVMRVMGVLQNADLTTTTTAAIRRQLEEDLGTDLSEKKAFIREQVDLYLQAQQQQHQQHKHHRYLQRQQQYLHSLQQQQQQQPFLPHYYAANYQAPHIVEDDGEVEEDNAVQPEPEPEPRRLSHAKTERAKKNGNKWYGDKIVLRGLKFSGVHGVNEEEKLMAQPFIVDVDAWMNMETAGKTDDLRDTVSYADVHRVIKEIVEGPHFDLLEALANSITTTIFSRFPSVTDVRVRISKPKVAAKKDAQSVGIEIFRTAPSERGEC